MNISAQPFQPRSNVKRERFEDLSSPTPSYSAVVRKGTPYSSTSSCTPASSTSSSSSSKPRLPACLLGMAPEIRSTGLSKSTPLVQETDPHRLRQRQKQVDYGKNTLGYDRYTQMIDKSKRARGDPVTPDITAKLSTKRWNGLVKAWRRRLHTYDPTPQSGQGGQGEGGGLFSPPPANATASLSSPPSGCKTDHDSGDDKCDEESGSYREEEEEEEENNKEDQHIMKKSRVDPYHDEDEARDQMEMDEIPKQHDDKGGYETDHEEGEDEEEQDEKYELNRSAAMEQEEEEVCYSDDDLL